MISVAKTIKHGFVLGCGTQMEDGEERRGEPRRKGQAYTLMRHIVHFSSCTASLSNTMEYSVGGSIVCGEEHSYNS